MARASAVSGDDGRMLPTYAQLSQALGLLRDEIVSRTIRLPAEQQKIGDQIYNKVIGFRIVRGAQVASNRDGHITQHIRYIAGKNCEEHVPPAYIARLTDQMNLYIHHFSKEPYLFPALGEMIMGKMKPLLPELGDDIFRSKIIAMEHRARAAERLRAAEEYAKTWPAAVERGGIGGSRGNRR